MAYPDFIVCVPVIAPRDVTAAARAHWDVDSVDLIVVDNTPTGEYELGPWRYHRDPAVGNLGVAASWNVGLALDCDLTIFMSSYLELDEGLAATVARMREAANEYGCVTWQAMHLFSITRKTVEICGTFDEGYKAGYYEDVDAIVRWEIGGCHTPDNPMPKLAIPGVCPQAKSMTLGLVDPPMDANRSRFERKWGGSYPSGWTYRTPFNDPALTIRDWGPE